MGLDEEASQSSGANVEAHEHLYDLYIEAALSGDVESPDAFLTRHQFRDAALRAKLLELFETASIAKKTPRPDSSETASDLPRPFGEFTLLQRLGEGGMGVVFLAEQRALGRQVALKIIRPEFARSATAPVRFEREARAIARLRHANIVAVHAAGEIKGVHYIAMEFVPGRGLDEILREAKERGERVPIATSLRWIAQIARALHFAHEHGIVHRDVKPSNIRITPDPESQAMLLDFGVARDLQGDGATLTEAFVGSPIYVAPEQVSRKGGEVDARTDVYSLGIVLYQCLTGEIPFREGSLEHVLHQVLTEDPKRLRIVAPALPRELEIVVHKALEKQPAQRYTDAEAFAEDLTAILEFRPIRARPPGVAGRLSKWARRNVALAATAVTAVAAVIALISILTAQQIADRSRRLREAEASLAEARGIVSLIRERRAESEQIEDRLEQLQIETIARYFSPEDDRLLDEAEEQVTRMRRDRERDFHRALDLLSRAERLGSTAEAVMQVRGELYLSRYFDAALARDPVEMSMYRDLAKQNDPSGSVALELIGGSRLSLTTEPPGAEVHVFRMMDLADVVGGVERRMVPVPLYGVGPVSPGAFALRIGAAVKGNDGPEVNDLILEVDRRPVQLSDLETIERGGAEANVLHKGELRLMKLTSGLLVRPTAAPLTLETDSLIGNAPIVDLELEAGDYLLMLRADGHADQRVALYISRGADRNVHVALEPQHSTPPGFVRVVNYRYGIEEHDFHIMEREVTVREYFEFLHDPETLAEIEASPQVIRIPRSTIEGLHAPRGPDGRFTLGDELQWDWPIFGISWHDANAYAMWKTRQARLAGRNETYALPTLDEWAAAAGLCYGCKHVFGNRFRHKWVCSVYSKPKADPQPVMSYPIDESCFGVYDMSGSVSEWLNSFWREEKGTYRHAGGSWAHGGSGMFQAYGGNGLPPDNYSDTVGFRLVMRRDVHDD